MEDIKVLQFVYDNFDITDVPPYGPSYILPDGKFVDIYGTTINDKHLDTHYDVETVLNDNGLSSDEFDSLSLNYTIQECGAIRCSTRTHEHYILLNEERPTTNQYDSILKLLILMSDDLGYPSVQIIADKDTYKIYNFTDYEPEEIVGKIKRYYSSGNLYEAVERTVRNALNSYENYKSKYGNDALFELKYNFRLQDEELVWIINKLFEKGLMTKYDVDWNVNYLNLEEYKEQINAYADEDEDSEDDTESLSDIAKKYGVDLTDSLFSKTDLTKNVLSEDTENSDVGYHYGDLGKADYKHQFGDRNTGGFGTGTYFVGTPVSQRKDSGSYKNRPEHVVDFSKYNLFRPRNNEQAYRLHDALLAINNMSVNIKHIPQEWGNVLDEFDEVTKEYFAPLDALDDDDYTTPVKLNKKALAQYIRKYIDYYPYKIEKDDDLMDIAREIESNLLEEARNFKTILNNLSSGLGYYNDEKLRNIVVKALQDKSDVAPSTLIMKSLGYDGIDVRHLDHDAQGLSGLDNFGFGSVIYDLKEDINGSIKDSNGKTLTEEQYSFFKDSAVRDDIGRLLVCYHGSPSKFTTFMLNDSGNYPIYGKGFYFTNKRSTAKNYSDRNGTIYKVYLNIKNPYHATTKDEGYLNRDKLISQGYDGVIANIGGDEKYFIVFDSNQIKSTDNKNPTISDNINEWMSETVLDSVGRTISGGQITYFKDSKVRDSSGRLLPVYHGTKDNFTVFKHGHMNRNDSGYLGDGFYFTDNIDSANSYSKWKRGNDYNSHTMEVYLNITNPLVLEHKQWATVDLQDFLGLDLLTDDQKFDFKVNQEISNKLTKEVQKRGYDGIIYHNDFYDETIYVVYNSNQIKSVTNETPTSSDDINESILEEDIEGMKKYYPNIPDEKFQELIELDPTYKKGSNNAGTYGKWILGLANKNNGELDNIGHITDVIKRFDQNKKQLKNKDIMQFKSVEEVDDYLNNEDNYNELTDRQKLRQTQKNVRNTDVDKDATKVFENSMWEVWVPNTYEASCKLGQGTEWCTATTSTRDYFDSYTRDGKLYININKPTGNKYQFHFESESFMDADDEEIDIEDFFLTNEDLAKFYSNIDSTGIAKRMLMLVERRNQIKDGEVIYTQSDYDSGLRFAPIGADVTGVIVKCKKVGKYAFEGCNNISVVVLEEGVEEIEEDAFAYCGYISMLYIPSTLKLIGDCFVGTTIGNLHITSIEAWNNVKFTSVNSIPNGGNLYIGDSLIKNLTVSENIKEYCFSDFDSIETVDVKEGVTKIGQGAFTGCKKLTTVKLPNTLNKMGNYTFFGCESLKSINIPESLEFTEDGNGEFMRSGLESITIPGTAKVIPSRFLSECTNLKNVAIGDGIETIQGMSFAGCSSLQSIFIPKSVKTVKTAAFRSMSGNFTIYCEVDRDEADSAGYWELLRSDFYYHVVFGAKREQSN